MPQKYALLLCSSVSSLQDSRQYIKAKTFRGNGKDFLYISCFGGESNAIGALSQYPLYRNAKPHVFVLHPGEMVLVPRGWWHYGKYSVLNYIMN
jgi:hypothetical protein